MDERIQLLARGEVPDGGLTQARALVRAGRRGDALRTLHLADVPEGAYAEAHALAEELWRHEVASFEPAVTIARGVQVWSVCFDLEDRLVTWHEVAGPIHVCSAVDGSELLTLEDPPESWLPARGRFFFHRRRDLEFGSVEPGEAGRLQVRPRPLDEPAWAWRAHPSGEAIVLLSAAGFQVRSWPAWELLRDGRGYGWPEADWGARRILGRVSPTIWHAVSIDACPLPEACECRPESQLLPLGDGRLLLWRGDGCELRGPHSLAAETATPLAYPSPRVPSLSHDRRWLRGLVRERMVRIELTSSPKRDEGGVCRNAQGHGWHPVADLLVDSGGVLAFDGSAILPYSEAMFCTWSTRGHAALFLAHRCRMGETLELWRARA